MYEQQDLQPRSKSGAGDEEKRTEKLFSIHFTSEKPLDLYLVHPDKVFGCGVGMSSILTKTPTLKLRSDSSPFCVSLHFFFVVFCDPCVGRVFHFHAWDSSSLVKHSSSRTIDGVEYSVGDFLIRAGAVNSQGKLQQQCWLEIVYPPCTEVRGIQPVQDLGQSILNLLHRNTPKTVFQRSLLQDRKSVV